MSDSPTPDRFGRYRVAETVDGKTRHYSTKRFLPGVHKIVEGQAASYGNGQERPAKFPAPARQAPGTTQQQAPQSAPAPTTAPADSPKGADK